MKTNEAPEKIWINPSMDLQKLNRVIDKDSIQYVRKDAFIEKTCDWLKNHYRDYMYNPTGKRLEAFFGGDMCNDFENYIKGE
jgi:hypothetical protein